MDEYINKREVLRDWHSFDEPADVFQYIKDFPPTDVRPVVFCKDCENWVEEIRAGHKDLGNYVCACAEWSNNEDGHMVFTGPEEYCSRGIRRESDETD